MAAVYIRHYFAGSVFLRVESGWIISGLFLIYLFMRWWVVFGRVLPGYLQLIPAYGEDLKCGKGNWWMPWHREAMKDVALCDKLWGGESNL